MANKLQGGISNHNFGKARIDWIISRIKSLTTAGDILDGGIRIPSFDFEQVDKYGNYLNLDIGYEVLTISRSFSNNSRFWIETEYIVDDISYNIAFHQCFYEMVWTD